jgi:hypothetical protein
MRMPYSNLIIVAILSLLLPSSVIFTAMSPSSLISNQIESLFADDKDKINFFLANINDGSRNVLLEQASAQESESDVEEEQPEEEDVVEEEQPAEEESSTDAQEEEGGAEEEDEEDVLVEEESSTDAQEEEDGAEEEEQPAEEESSADAQEEENVPPPQENIGNKTVGSPRNQSIPAPIPIDNSNSTNATTTVPINNNTNTTGLNGTLGNPITISKTFPVKGTSGLDVTITITPIINGPELSGVTNVRKESDGPANPPLRQEFSYYMPFSMLPTELQQEILAANPGTVAQGSSSPPSPLPSSSPSPSEIAPAAAAAVTTRADGSSSSTYNRQTAEGVTPALLTTTTEEDSGGGQLGEGNKDNDSYDIVPVQSLGGLIKDKIKAVKVLVEKGIKNVPNFIEYLSGAMLANDYRAHLKEMKRYQDCLNNLPDSELVGRTREERQQYLDLALENMHSMYYKKTLLRIPSNVVGDVIDFFKMITGKALEEAHEERIYDSNIENALAIARESAGCKEFPTSMEIFLYVTHDHVNWIGSSVIKLQFPKVGPEATFVTGTGKFEGTNTYEFTSDRCSLRAEAHITGDLTARIDKTGPSSGMRLSMTLGPWSPTETPLILTRGDPTICKADILPYPTYPGIDDWNGEILPPRQVSFKDRTGLETVFMDIVRVEVD